MQFTLKATFPTDAETLYKAWLSSEQHSNMTGAPAQIGRQIGDRFHAWDGYISGTHLELKPYSKIVQSWRTTEFSEMQEDSVIELHFEDKVNQVELTLTHSNLDKADTQYEQGWLDHYFKPMTKYFMDLMR